jgi:hypothetical protein
MLAAGIVAKRATHAVREITPFKDGDVYGGQDRDAVAAGEGGFEGYDLRVRGGHGRKG